MLTLHSCVGPVVSRLASLPCPEYGTLSASRPVSASSLGPRGPRLVRLPRGMTAGGTSDQVAPWCIVTEWPVAARLEALSAVLVPHPRYQCGPRYRAETGVVTCVFAEKAKLECSLIVRALSGRSRHLIVYWSLTQGPQGIRGGNGVVIFKALPDRMHSCSVK